MDKHGIVRFKENKIVSRMYDIMTDLYKSHAPVTSDYTDEDNEHFSQLIGVRWDDYKGLPFTTPETIAVADVMYREKISEDKARIKWLEKRVKELENQIGTAS